MSNTLPTNVICPGQRNLMDDMGDTYLRVVCLIYWDGSSPSAQPFYLHEHRFNLTLSGIKTLQDEVIALLKQQNLNPIDAVYLGYGGVTMDDADVASVGWRLMSKPKG